jgi:hypothetical protein
MTHLTSLNNLKTLNKILVIIITTKILKKYPLHRIIIIRLRTLIIILLIISSILLSKITCKALNISNKDKPNKFNLIKEILTNLKNDFIISKK